MNEDIISCWDTFVLLDKTRPIHYWPMYMQRLYDLSGEMELARDEKDYHLANKCIRRFRRIVRKLVEKN